MMEKTIHNTEKLAQKIKNLEDSFETIKAERKNSAFENKLNKIFEKEEGGEISCIKSSKEIHMLDDSLFENEEKTETQNSKTSGIFKQSQTSNFRQTNRYEGSEHNVVDMASRYTRFFQFQGHKITYSGHNKVWTHIFGKESFKKRENYEFHFKIVNTSHGNINMGICDKRTLTNGRKPNMDECIYLSGDNGQIICPSMSAKFLSLSLKDHDIVIMRFNGYKFELSFEINKTKYGVTQGVRKYIEHTRKEIIPFVSFYRKGDAIEWYC